MSNTTIPATIASVNATIHTNEAAFGPPSPVNCVFKEHPNYETLKQAHAKAFEALASKHIDDLTRNELAFIRCVSNGSIKTSQTGATPKCAYDILANVPAQRAPVININTATAFIKTLSVEQRTALLEQLM